MKTETSQVVESKTFIPTPKTTWRPIILMVLVVASWASATVVTKHLIQQHLAVPLTLVAWRFTLAGGFALTLFFFGFKRRNDERLPLVGNWRVYLLGGGLITTFIVGFNLALLYITATLGGLVFFALNTVVMIGVGHFWLGTSFGGRQVAGVLLALLGMTVTISGGDWNHLVASLTGSNLPFGLLLMALGALGWGVYGLWGKRYGSTKNGASLLSTGINQLIGVIPVWILVLLTDPGSLLAMPLESWLFLLYIGIVPSALGFALYYAILKDLSLNQAATIQLFSPVFTGVMAILFLNEPFSIALLIGAAILLWGVRICLSFKKK